MCSIRYNGINHFVDADFELLEIGHTRGARHGYQVVTRSSVVAKEVTKDGTLLCARRNCLTIVPWPQSAEVPKTLPFSLTTPPQSYKFSHHSVHQFNFRSNPPSVSGQSNYGAGLHWTGLHHRIDPKINGILFQADPLNKYQPLSLWLSSSGLSNKFGPATNPLSVCSLYALSLFIFYTYFRSIREDKNPWQFT